MEESQKSSEELNLSLRSDKAKDIMDKMPSWFVQWGITVFLALILVALFFAYIIKYPEIIVSQVKITTSRPPLKVVNKISGNLRLTGSHEQEHVTTGEYLAVIENPSITTHVVLLKEKLQHFKIVLEQPDSLHIHFFPGELSLGNLEPYYHEFLTAYQENVLFRDLNRNASQIRYLKEQIKNLHALQENHFALKEVKEEELSLFRKNDKRFDFLLAEKAITDAEYENAKIKWLNKLEAYQSFLGDLVRLKSQIQEMENSIQELQFEEEETDKRLKLALWKSYDQLLYAIDEWEQMFVLKAPQEGKVVYLDFWKDNEFVEAGEELFSVIPDNNALIAYAEMPTQGAGKVEEGQRVQIILDDYPHREFGLVTGYVTNISPLTKEVVNLTGKENFYLISVSLPHALETSYNKSLDFKYDMVGQAEIVTKERRFIERIFESVVAAFKK